MTHAGIGCGHPCRRQRRSDGLQGRTGKSAKFDLPAYDCATLFATRRTHFAVAECGRAPLSTGVVMSQVRMPPSIRNLIQVLRDGERGFRCLGEHATSSECRAFMLEEAVVRNAYANELGRAAKLSYGEFVQESSSTMGAIHRQWMDLKASLGASDQRLLGGTALCEWFAMRAYRRVLADGNVSVSVRDLVAAQEKGVLQSRSLVQDFRRDMRERL